MKPPRRVSPVVKQYWSRLQLLGNCLRGLYGAPVFLCGSALRTDNDDPRDFDIRIELPEADFEKRYGSVGKWMDEGGTGRWTRVRWQWSDDCVKGSRDGWERTRLNIDLQIYPRPYSRALYGKKRKIRLDSRGRR